MFFNLNTKTLDHLIDKEFICISKEESIKDVINKIIGHNQNLFVVEGGSNNVEGTISINDIHKICEKFNEFGSIKIKEVMNNKIVFVEKDFKIDDCWSIMIENNAEVAFVKDKDKIIGIIEKKNIREYMHIMMEHYMVVVNNVIGEIKEGICAIDKNGIVILWNKFMEKRYDIRYSEIVGRNINEFLTNTVSEKVLKSREPMNDVYYNNQKEELHGLVDANPVYIRNEFFGVVCTEVDITEAKRLSKELKKANDTLKHLQDEVKNLSKGSFDKILGSSYKLEKSKEIAKKVSKTTSSILIFGESGTGKEVFARSIHEHSERKGQFVPINCSAIPSELFESEFFGYESGAFTGANKKGKIGILELAKDGTVFLDEIGELPMNMQAKLLRVLQEKEVQRVGGEKIIKINCRIICATNKNLLELIKKNEFREDLYYRLNVVEIQLPPLRERKGDIEILIHTFLKNICEQNNKPTLNISKDVVRVLEKYKWKGNIRELKNTIETMVVLSKTNTIGNSDIPHYIVDSLKGTIEYEENEDLDITKSIQNLEIKMINKALSTTKGNKAKASKLLNIPRATLYYKMQQYDIEQNK